MAYYKRFKCLLITPCYLFLLGSFVSGCDGAGAGAGAAAGPVSYLVTGVAGDNGDIRPDNVKVVQGSNTTFTLLPLANYEIDTVTGCTGSLLGNNYTTGAINEACTVSATFRKAPYSIAWGRDESETLGNHICNVEGVFSYRLKLSFYESETPDFRNPRQLCGGQRPFRELDSYNTDSFFLTVGYSISGDGVVSCQHTEKESGETFILDGYSFLCQRLETVKAPLGAEKQSITLNIADYKLVDGIDLQSLEEAIASVDSDIELILRIPEGQFVFRRTLHILRSIKIIGQGSTNSFLLAAGEFEGNFIEISKEPQYIYLPIRDVYSGDTVIDLESGVSEMGSELCDHVVIKDDSQIWPFDPRDYVFYGEVSRANKVENMALYLNEPVRDNYNSERTMIAIYCQLDVEVNDVAIQFEQQNLGTKAISIRGATRVRISEVLIKNSGRVGIFIADSRNSIISDSFLSDGFPYDCDTCYGIQTYGVQDVIVENNFISDFRRGIDISGTHPSRRVLVKGNTVFADSNTARAASGMGTHGSADDVLFAGNLTDGGIISILLRGTNILVERNTFSNPEWAGVYLGSGTLHYIRNNIMGGRRTNGRSTKRGVEFHVPVELGNIYSLIHGNFIDAELGVRIATPPQSLYVVDNSIIEGAEYINIEFEQSNHLHTIVSEGWRIYTPSE